MVKNLQDFLLRRPIEEGSFTTFAMNSKKKEPGDFSAGHRKDKGAAMKAAQREKRDPSLRWRGLTVNSTERVDRSA